MLLDVNIEKNKTTEVVLVVFKKRYRLAGVKSQGLAQGNQVAVFIGDLDVVACCLPGLAHPASFGP